MVENTTTKMISQLKSTKSIDQLSDILKNMPYLTSLPAILDEKLDELQTSKDYMNINLMIWLASAAINNSELFIEPCIRYSMNIEKNGHLSVYDKGLPIEIPRLVLCAVKNSERVADEWLIDFGQFIMHIPNSTAKDIIDLRSKDEYFSQSLYIDQLYSIVNTYQERYRNEYLYPICRLIHVKYISPNTDLNHRYDIDDLFVYTQYLYRAILNDEIDLRDAEDSTNMILAQLTTNDNRVSNYELLVRIAIEIIRTACQCIKEFQMNTLSPIGLMKLSMLQTYRVSYSNDTGELRLVNPEFILPDPYLLYNTIGNEAYDPTSSKMDKASRKIYAGYKAYKDNEKKVDSQLTKLLTALRSAFVGGSPRDKVIEGNNYSPIKVLKKILGTAALFSVSKVGAIIFLITKYVLSKKVDNKARKEVLAEITLEIKMLDEKIEDARSDGNRQAKYSMMRIRSELQKSADQIRYGMGSTKNAKETTKAVLSGKISTAYKSSSREEED